MDTHTEKSALMEHADPRLSLCSIQGVIDQDSCGEVSFRKAFFDIFKKPSESTDDDADNGMLKHIVADISENKAGPDVNMKANGNPFNGHFLLRGSVPRPAVIAISSGKSKIACTFPEHEKDQPVHFCASSIHGTVQVGLPRDFDGFIVLQTLVGHVGRSSILKSHCSKVYNYAASKNLSATVYRVQPTVSPRNKKEDAKQLAFEHSNICRVTSSHGIVKVGYTDEMKVFSKEASKLGGECTVS